MSLIEHLDELRTRIIISLIAFLVGFVICFIFRSYLLDLLVTPLGDRKLLTLSPTESFMAVFKVSAYCGLILASPVIIYQIWAFVAPALKSKEKKIVVVASIFTSILFLVGVAFAWVFVLPRVLDFLLNYEGDFFDQQIQANRYFSFVSLFLLGFGIIFETPVMILTLVRMGVVDAQQLGKNRKYALLIGCVVSAVLTPPDIFSMLAMVIPFVLLYEASIHLSRLVQKRRHKQQDSEIVDEGPDVGETAG